MCHPDSEVGGIVLVLDLWECSADKRARSFGDYFVSSLWPRDMPELSRTSTSTTSRLWHLVLTWVARERAPLSRATARAEPRPTGLGSMSTLLRRATSVARERDPTGSSPYPSRRTVFSHQRKPTNRKRQSLRNSGGLPSNACPTNWNSQPAKNNPAGILQNPRTSGAIKKSGIDTAIIGIPTK